MKAGSRCHRCAHAAENQRGFFLDLTSCEDCTENANIQLHSHFEAMPKGFTGHPRKITLFDDQLRRSEVIEKVEIIRQRCPCGHDQRAPQTLFPLYLI